MLSSNPLVVVGVFLLVLFFVALIVGLVLQRRRTGRDTRGTSPDWVNSVSSAAPATGELIASPVSEAIEDMVRERLLSDPELKKLEVDFGTSTDGSLEIWIGEDCYTEVSSIPNGKIRKMIQDAVRTYNEGTG